MRKESSIMKEAQIYYEKKLEYVSFSFANSSANDGSFKSMLEVNELLEKIREEVKNTLRKKQENCSRLCFMGYDSLIIFLRELVKREKLNISQLFPGLDSIDVSENSISIVKRSTCDLELVRLVTLFLANKALTLDTWVVDLENALIQTFKEKISRLNVAEDNWWEDENDAQILITAEMIFFSKNINSKDLGEKLRGYFEGIIQSIRSGKWHLEKLSIVLLVQLSLLESIKKDPICWDFSLKYATSPCLQLQVLNYSIDFCYEFHNLADFTYIPTPVTDKLMLHIVNCVVTHQTVLLSGNSNAGKTSTLKEVALYCGKGIVFWTAVKESTFMVLMSIVSGCASGGFWGVIEEIHNVEISVLSSILYYLYDIIQKLIQDQSRLMLCERILRIKQGFSIFFTSSYPRKIPEFLTKNLRLVNIVQPDFRSIISIKLEALGFNTKYSYQIATIFNLLSNNFESMSGEKSSLVIPKSLSLLNALLKLCPFELNDNAIVDAFRQLFGPELSPIDKKILNEILLSVFPEYIFCDEVDENGDIFHVQGYKSNNDTLLRAKMLLEMVKSKHKWLIVTGTACCGKSTLIGVCANQYSKKLGKGFLVHKLSDVNSENLFLLVSLCEKANDGKYSYCSYPIGDSKSPSNLDWIVMDARSKLDWDALNYISRGEIYVNASQRVIVPKSLKLFIECENLSEFTPGDLKNYNIVNVSEEMITASEIYEAQLDLLDDPELKKIFQPLFGSLVETVYNNLRDTYFNYSLKIWTVQLMRIVFKMVKEAKSLLSKKYDSLWAQIYKNSKTKHHKNPLGTSTLANSIVISDSYIPQQVDKKGEIILNTIEFLNLSRNPPIIDTQSMYESIFLCSVIYTFGTCTKDKPLFHKVILDFLSHQRENYASNIIEQLLLKSVFDLCYVIESQEWVEWDKELLKNKKSMLKRQLTLRKSTRALVEVTKALDSMYIQTKESKKYIYWLSYYLNSGISSVIIGQHQSGKTLLSTTLLKKQLSQGYLGYLPISLTSNTTVQNIKSIVSTSLDQVKEFYFACVGGVKQYVYIDDLNLDQSNNIYELLRFWKENKGWYNNNNFYFIGQMEVLAVHGYSANRRLYPRALRHFNIIYKEPYSSKDISLIFRTTVDSDIASISESHGDLFSTMDLAIDFFKKLFKRTQQINSERYGINLSLSAYMLALRKLSTLPNLESSEVDEFLKSMTYVYNSYLYHQVPQEFKELREVMQTTFLEFMGHFQNEIPNEKSIEDFGIMVDCSYFTDEAPEDVVMTKELLEIIIPKFDEDVDNAKRHNFEELKPLHYVFNKPEETLGKYILTYIRLINDLKDCNNVSILCSQHESHVLKALVHTAAETLQIPIYSFTQNESHFNDFSSVSEFYLPIEAKFMLKEVVNRTGGNNEPTIVIIDTKEYANDAYVLAILELFNDMFSACAFKMPTCYKYYKSIIEKLKRNDIDMRTFYDEQVMMSALEKIKKHVKIVILANTGFTKFSRIEKLGILEELKHRCRTLFNCSKIICYENINVPFFVVQTIIVQGSVLDKWLNSNDRSIYTDFLKKYSEIIGTDMVNNYEIEKMCYLTEEIKSQNRLQIQKSIDKLNFAIGKVDKIEMEIESFREKVQSISEETASLTKEIKEKYKEQSLIIAKNQKIHSEDYVPPFVLGFQEQKQEFLRTVEVSRLEFEDTREALAGFKNDFTELGTMGTFQPGLLLCAAYIQYLITPKSKFPQPITLEALEPLAKPLINNLAFSFASAVKKIKKIQIEAVLYNQDVVTNPFYTTFAGNKGQKAYKTLVKLVEAIHKYKSKLDELGTLRQEWQKTEDEHPEQIKEAVGQVSEELMSILTQVNEAILKIEIRMSNLNETQENIERIRPKAHQILRNLNQKKIKWQDEILVLEKAMDSLSSYSTYISFMILVAFTLPNPLRNNILEAGAELVKLRDQNFQGVPKSPSMHFDHVIELQTKGKRWKGYHILSNLSFFQQVVAGVKAVFNFYLPYPMIIDPFKIFEEFIHEDEGDDLTVLTLDAGFEHVLDKLMAEGRAALIVNPSYSMRLALVNLIGTRIKYFISRSRKLPHENLTIRIANQFIKFNPNFRLYICSDTIIPEFSEMFTVLSMEMEGNEWKTMLYAKIQKHLDPIEYTTKLENLKSTYMQKDQSTMEDKEAVKILTAGFSSENPLEFFTFLQKIWKTLYISEYDIPKIHKSYFKDDTDHEIFECPEALDELYQFYKIIMFTNNVTKPYVIQESTLVDMIIDTIRELSHIVPDLTIPRLSQSTEVLSYILLVWIYSTMPSYSGLILIMYFVMSKHLEMSPGMAQDITSLFKDIHNIQHLTSEQVVKILQKKYLHLLPEGFGEMTIKHLENFELYRDCRLPKTLPPAVKLFVYAKMRVDLVPQATFEMLTDLMGFRYSFMPQPFFHKIALYCESTRPVVVICEENSPIEMIKTECEEMAIHLETLQPLLRITNGSDRRDNVQINCKYMIKPLTQKAEFKKWFVIENANVINPNEVDSLMSAILIAISDPLCKVLLILYGDISSFPHLAPIFELSYRMYFKAPNTVKERFVDWCCWHDKAYYIKHRRNTLEKYHYHLSPTPTVTTRLFSKKGMKTKGVLRKLSSALVFTSQVQNILSFAQNDEVSNKNLLLHLPYNLSLFTSFMYLRGNFTNEFILSYMDTLHIIKNLVDYLSKVDEKEKFNSVIKYVDTFWPGELTEIFETIMTNSNSVSVMVDGRNIIYPLFGATKREGFDGIEALLELMSSEDHLKVVGVEHAKQKDRQLQIGKKVLAFIPEFLHRMKSSVMTKHMKQSIEVRNSSIANFDTEKQILRFKSILPTKVSMLITTTDANVFAFSQHEVKDYEGLFTDVTSKLTAVGKFVQYGSSLLTKNLNRIFKDLKEDRVPKIWRKKEPYCLRKATTCTEWLQTLAKIVASPLEGDLRISYNPLRFFYFLLRTQQYSRLSLIARPGEGGIKGLCLVNALIDKDGMIAESNTANDLPSLVIEKDEENRYDCNYVAFDTEAKGNLVFLPVFETTEIMFVFRTKLSQRYCRFKNMRVDVKRIMIRV